LAGAEAHAVEVVERVALCFDSPGGWEDNISEIHIYDMCSVWAPPFFAPAQGGFHEDRLLPFSAPPP
jgi:hypothetical protein